ncbi:MAG: hypothetical protein AB7L13_11100 [Acidimicrobiia bacterium]
MRTAGIDPELFVVKREPVKASQRALLFAGAGLALCLGVTLSIVNQSDGKQQVATGVPSSAKPTSADTATTIAPAPPAPAPSGGSVAAVAPGGAVTAPVTTVPGPTASTAKATSGGSSTASTTGSGDTTPSDPVPTDPAPVDPVVADPAPVTPTVKPSVAPAPTTTIVAPPATTAPSQPQQLSYSALGAGNVKIKITGDKIGYETFAPATGWTATVTSKDSDNSLTIVFKSPTKIVTFSASMINGFIDVKVGSTLVPTTSTVVPTTVRGHGDDSVPTNSDAAAPALASSTLPTA